MLPFGNFDPASRGKVLIGIFDELVVVLDAVEDITGVDEVKVILPAKSSASHAQDKGLKTPGVPYLLPSPLLIQIIYLELNIRINPTRLNRTQIHSNNLCLRMNLAEVQCPNSSPRTSIKYTMNLLGNRSEVELAVEKEEEDVVVEIKTVLFRFVVGDVVVGIAVTVVAPTVFVDVFA